MAKSVARLLGPESCSVRRVSTPSVVAAKRDLAQAQTYRGVAELFGALADQTRVTIMHALARRELCTCDLAAVAGVTESGVSQHLRILRALRLVKARRAGRFVYYALDDEHVGAILSMGLAHQGHSELAEADVQSEAASA